MSAAFPATLEACEHFCSAFRQRLNRLDSSFHSTDRFTAELLLREALANATVHGSGTDPSKQVHCRWRISGRRLTIAVRDEGPGFDWKEAFTRSSPNWSLCGRGLPILRACSARIRFNRKGNAVVLVKCFSMSPSAPREG